ncbi:MAG TPA: indole-3-glycerol phosphate synthase TrpC [Candidatus Polarisedimenticolia bacterium]|nr:indole-3-glycerol phosphate synthase TrpC [Candidatus Polarisedimenticolia bacterium]
MDILDRIVRAKRAQVERDKERLSQRRAIELATSAPPPRDFAAALRREGRVNVIAEIKKASPSRGDIQARADVGGVAEGYSRAGAVALSVLTESRFFLGSGEDLGRAKQAVDIPVLRKDFVLEEYQVYESRVMGADSLLLIARILSSKELSTLIGVARSLHMEPLVEVHDEEEARRTVDGGGTIIGVNNRDLATLNVSIDTSLRIGPLLPESTVRVSESGIESRQDIDRLRSAGFHAFLIGERLMREADPGGALRGLLGEEAS